MKIRKTIKIELSPSEKDRLVTAVNLHYLNDEHCNVYEDGGFVSKYPDKETIEFKYAQHNVRKTRMVDIELEFDVATGNLVGLKEVKK